MTKPGDMDIGVVEPALDDVLDEPIHNPAILVRQEGSIRTHEMPTRSGGMLSSLVNATESIAGSDPRRKRLVIMSKDQDVYVGNTRGSVDSGGAMYWPKNTQLEINHCDQVFIRSADATPPAQSTLVSVLVENWAD